MAASILERLDEAERDGDVFCRSDRLAASPQQQVAQRVGQRRLVFDNEHPDAVRWSRRRPARAQCSARSAALSASFRQWKATDCKI